MKIAIIFGSSGLIGNHLLNILINDIHYSKIKIFVRGKSNIDNPKVEIIYTDFKSLNDYSDLIKGDDCFYCIGTTKKNTPDKYDYRRIEYDLPTQIGQIANKNKIRSFSYISSLGASIKTKNLYLRNKGETEEFLKNLNFSNLYIIRPSLLLGSRNEFRLGELIGQKLFKSLYFLFQGSFKKYRAIESKDVAKAIINISKNKLRNVNFESDHLQDLSKKN